MELQLDSVDSGLKLSQELTPHRLFVCHRLFRLALIADKLHDTYMSETLIKVLGTQATQWQIEAMFKDGRAMLLGNTSFTYFCQLDIPHCTALEKLRCSKADRIYHSAFEREANSFLGNPAYVLISLKKANIIQ